MADVPQTVALMVLAQNYRGRIVNQTNRRSTLLKTLPIVPGMGLNCAWAAKSSGALAENYAEGAAAANFGSDAETSAILGWGHYRANFHITGTARRVAASTTSPEGVENVVGKNMMSAMEALLSLINDDAFDGAGTGTLIAGLDVAIGDDTNTYATIDRTANAFWRPYVIDPGVATALSFPQIRTDMGAIYDACGEPPDLAFCSTAVFNTLGALYDSSRRYVDTITTARGVVRLDAGYQALEVDGCMFLRAKDATAHWIYYVNSNHVRFEYLPLEVPMMEQLESLGAIVTANDGYGAVPLGINIHALGKVGDADRFECLTNIQLVVERPNSCGVRKNVATV